MSDQITHLEPVLSATGGAPGTITLRLPKLNWQSTALILLALVAGFQTFQLTRLKGNVSVRPAAAAASTSAHMAAPSAAPSGGGLQSMVGGC